MGMVSSLTHFPLEPGCEDYSLLDLAGADFEQSLESILTDPVETPKLDASCVESVGVPSSSHQDSFAQLVPHLICLNCSWLLA